MSTTAVHDANTRLSLVCIAYSFALYGVTNAKHPNLATDFPSVSALAEMWILHIPYGKSQVRIIWYMVCNCMVHTMSVAQNLVIFFGLFNFC